MSADDLALAGWNARQHDVRTGRTRKGATTQEVTRYGAAVVHGSLTDDSDGMPLLASSGDVHKLHPSASAARQLLLASERDATDSTTRRTNHVIGRKRFGLSTLDVLRITDATYREHGLEPLLTGTEVRQFEQVIHRDRAAQARVTAHSVGLDGGSAVDVPTRLMLRPTTHADGSYSVSCSLDSTIGEIVAQAAANVPQTGSMKAWPTRGATGDTRFGRLPMVRRNSDPSTARVHRDDSGELVRVVEVVTIGADVVGLPTVTDAPIPQVAPRSDWTRRTGQTVLSATGVYGPRGIIPNGVRVRHPGITSVTDHAGSAITRTVFGDAPVTPVERLFVGHRVVDRLPAIVKTETARDDRTTLTVEASTTADTVERPTTEQEWTKLLRKLEVGKRADLGDITCTRGTDRYRATVHTAEGSRSLRARTAEGLAHLLAA